MGRAAPTQVRVGFSALELPARRPGPKRSGSLLPVMPTDSEMHGMDYWFRHFAVDDKGEWVSAQRAACRSTGSAIAIPVLALAGTIAITGGDPSCRTGAAGHIGRVLSGSLEVFQVVSETIDSSATTLTFQAVAATEDEDAALKAIDLACRTAPREAPSAGTPVVARVVSLRTKRLMTSGRQRGRAA